MSEDGLNYRFTMTVDFGTFTPSDEVITVAEWWKNIVAAERAKSPWWKLVLSPPRAPDCRCVLVRLPPRVRTCFGKPRRGRRRA